ncbi:restriction endonuclease subunit S [Limnohabitans sp. 63ED37-2]|uniref:restriction endonuclease subunit S n=1 Tax=Limnohabitans sp. 63ED37-2 TaxID=1678128 RepID=UPI0018D12643|nr:restriction endonuclease subunit S [Limnohabitans sp. 63ED37-2]
MTHDSPITYGVVKPGDEGEVPFVRGGDITDGLVRIDQLRTITTTVSQQYKRTLLSGGELLISLVGQPGQVAVATQTLAGANIARQVGLIRLQDIVDAHFVSYFLRSPDGIAGLGKFTGGSVQQVINLSDLRQVPVPLPPLDEQRRIVTILDEAFADIATAKANAEKNLQNARELFTRISGSVLAHYANTSQEITLEELVEPDCSLSYGIVQPGDEMANGLHIVRPVDMTTDVVMLDGLKRIDPSLANSYARTTLKGNDILLCVRGTTGTVALAHSELAGANVTRGIVPIRFDPAKLSQRFGYYLLRSEPAQLQIQAKTYGTALQQINIRDLRQLTLPVPAPQDQEVIVQRLSALEEETKQLTAAYENKLTALDDLKKFLLHQAFSGQL